MKEEEKTIVEQTVENPTVVNEDITKTEDEAIVDDNTTTEDSDVDDTLVPPVDEPVVSTEDQTLAPTDDVIPAPEDGAAPIVEPVADAPVVDPVVDTPVVDEPVDAVEPEIVNPVVDAPVEPVVDPVVDAPVDVPVDAPVEVPGSEVVDPIIPEDPAPVVTDPVVVGDENPVDDAGCACGEAGCDCGCEEPTCDSTEIASCSSPVTVANLFGTLQECVTIAWRFHLKTRKHHVHVTLNEFYDKALDVVDDIIEQYQGICGVVEDTFTNCVVGDGKTEGEYFTELKAFVENNKCVLGDHSEINSTIDEFLALIDSTLYKLTSFTESAVKSFDEFVYEDYQTIKESCHYDRFGDRHSDDPDDEDFDPEFENGECAAEEEEE